MENITNSTTYTNVLVFTDTKTNQPTRETIDTPMVCNYLVRVSFKAAYFGGLGALSGLAIQSSFDNDYKLKPCYNTVAVGAITGAISSVIHEGIILSCRIVKGLYGDIKRLCHKKTNNNNEETI
jgi:hypothetical protein